MNIAESDDDDEEEVFSDPRTYDPMLEAMTREDATRSPSSFQPALFRFFS